MSSASRQNILPMLDRSSRSPWLLQVVAAGGEALGDPGGLPGGEGCAGHGQSGRVRLAAARAD